MNQFTRRDHAKMCATPNESTPTLSSAPGATLRQEVAPHGPSASTDPLEVARLERAGAEGSHAGKADPGFVLVKAKGGMGNRLLCSMTGLAYAKLAGRRCVIDWTDVTYSNNGENAFPRFFECDGVDAIETLPAHATIQPAVWAGHVDQSVSEMLHTYDPDKHSSPTIGRKYSINPRRLEYPSDIVVYWSYTERFYALGKHLRASADWPDTSHEALRFMLNRHLRLQPDIQAQVDAFRQKNFSGQMIGLHLRCTDRTMDIEKPIRIVKEILKKHPDAGIFVATDNREVLNRLERECRNVMSTPKWYPQDGQSMHQNDSCPDKYENGVEALVDMWLLAECDYLVYASRSTFSYVSAMLSGAPRERIIDVDRWNPAINLKRWIRRVCE